MRVDLGNKLEFEFSDGEVTLPKVSESYYLIKEVTGRGQLVGAHFRFDTDKVFFKLEMNGEVFMELDVDSYNEFCGFKGNSNAFSSRHAIVFNEDEKMLSIKFELPIQYQLGLKFYAKTNDGNKTKKMKGYTIATNRETE